MQLEDLHDLGFTPTHIMMDLPTWKKIRPHLFRASGVTMIVGKRRMRIRYRNDRVQVKGIA